MNRTLRYWGRILLANAAGALAVVGITGAFPPSVSWHTFVDRLTLSLVYANCIGTLLAATIPYIAGRCWENDYRIKWTILLAAIVALTAGGTLAANVLLLILGTIPRRQFWSWFISSFEISLTISLILCIAITTYEIARSRLERAELDVRTRERDAADARRIAAEAQLASLESRVEPHFLFNTLNSIAALIHDDPVRAERMTEQLASLMRSSLQQRSARLVPLEHELRVVRDYLEIERVRFGDRLRYDLHVDGTTALAIPPLSIQTLVENSVKYAVSPRREGGSVVVRASGSNGRVRLQVEDDGPGFNGEALPSGHGLALLRDRLALTFGGRATLTIESRPGKTAVSIDLPAGSADPKDPIEPAILDLEPRIPNP
jgi:sensor histidine kinase YesM